jgi:hypothetical protein
MLHGVIVMRFTASEVYADLHGVVANIIVYANRFRDVL